MKKIAIFDDESFQNLSLHDKQRIATNYFDREISDDDFLKLDPKDQSRIRNNFINAQLDFSVRDSVQKAGEAFGSLIPSGTIPSSSQRRKSQADTPSTKLSDYGNIIEKGAADIVKGAGWAIEHGADAINSDTLHGIGTSIKQEGDSASKFWEDRLSPEAKAARNVQFTARDANGDISVSDTINNILSHPATVGLMASESLAATGLGMGVGGVLAKGFQLIPSIGEKLASALGYGIGEGAVAAPEQGASTEEKVMAMDSKELLSHPEYRAVLAKSGGNEAAAKIAVAKAAAGDAAMYDFVTTTLLSSPFGYVMSPLFAGAGKEGADLVRKAIGKETLMGGLEELGQETAQSGAEQFDQNYAIKDRANLHQSLSDGVIESMVAGGVSGMAMGAGMAGGQTALNNRALDTHEQKMEALHDAYLQDAYNKAMMGGGTELQLSGDPLDQFNQQVNERIKTVQDALTNLAINHPSHEIPQEAYTNPAVAEAVIQSAQDQGLNTGDNNGLNQIDIGYTQVADEMGVDLSPIAETAQEPTVATDIDVGHKRLKELEAIPSDELTLEQQWELEDLTSKIDAGVKTPERQPEETTSSESNFPRETGTVTDPMIPDETVWHDSPAIEGVTLSNSERVNEGIIDTLNAKMDGYVYRTEEKNGEQGTYPVLMRKKATQEEMTDQRKTVLVGSEFRNLFDVGTLIEPNVMKTRSLSKEKFKRFNDYLKSNGIGEYSRERKGFVITNQDVLDAFFPTESKTEEVVQPSATSTMATPSQDQTQAIEDTQNADGYQHLEAEIQRYDELSSRLDLTPKEEQEQEALGETLKPYLEDTTHGNTTATTEAVTGDQQSTQTRDGAVPEVPGTGEHTGGGQSVDAQRVPADASKPVKIVFDVNKVYSVDNIEADYPIQVLSKTIKKDVAKYVQQLVKATGFEVETDKNGKPLPSMGVTVNIPPAGGEVMFKLFKPNSDVGIYVTLRYQPDILTRSGGYDNYKLTDGFGGQMYRTVKGSKDYTGGRNNYVKSSELTSDKFVRDIIRLVDQAEAKAKEANNDATGTRTGSTDTIRAGDTTGISTGEQKPSNQSTASGSNGSVSAGHQRPNRSDATPSNTDGISSTGQSMGGYETAGTAQPPQPQQTDANEVLPKSDERHSSGEIYSLEGKAPVELTKGQRKKYNEASLEIIQKPLDEITDADRDILRHYTGEGGLGEVNENSVNQHYTHYETVEAMYKALRNADIPMDKSLEPAVGSGNFVGFNPTATWDVVDIDTTNIEVVKRLYPQIKSFHAETYETFKGKNYDLIISNVPFASENMLMREHAMTIKPAFKAIHNFYFAHSIEKVKDNGVVAFMTSTGTMDGTTQARVLRQYLMDRGDIIGAYRLPEKSQAKNAHTDTMIDIIFIQKRPEGVASRQEATNQQFVNVGNKEGYPMNEYFIAHPENLLGDSVVIDKDKTKMGKEGWIVKGAADYSKMKLSYEPYKVQKKGKSDKRSFESLDDALAFAVDNALVFETVKSVHPFSKISDGRMVYFDEEVTITDSTQKVMFGKILHGENAQKAMMLNRIMSLTEDGVRNGDKGLLATAMGEIESYKELYGKAPHEDIGFKKFMKDHRSELKLKEYMSYFDKNFTPAPIYTEQTRFADSGRMEISADSPINERAIYYADADGVLDTSKAYEYLSAAEISELERSRDFVRSDDDALQLDYLYYAGNVYEKLDTLEAMHTTKMIEEGYYQEQYRKLKAVIPAHIPYSNITVRGDESWLPESVRNAITINNKAGIIEATTASNNSGSRDQKVGNYVVRSQVFDNDLIKTDLYQRYLDKTALAPKKKDESDQENIERTMEANRILTEVLIPQVMHYIESKGLSDDLTEAYNRHSNFFVRPAMTGRLLRELPKSFRGKPFKMQSHQLEGAEKIVYNKKGVLAFAPGGGKTVTAIVAAMNLIQQGVMKKPIFVVPVNTIAQWENSVKELYPDAKVFEFPKIKSGVNKGQAKEWAALSREEKEQMAYDLANNRYDFTIIGDTMFQKFGLPSDVLDEYIDDLVNQIQSEEDADEDADAKEKKGAISAESKRRALKRGLKNIYGGDVEFDFAKMGFDAIFADEVQYYKNIGFGGKDAKGGLGTAIDITYYDADGKILSAKDIKEGKEPESAKLGSMRSYDFRFKTKYVSQRNNGNNVVLLTGTPTPNKPLELYTLLSHLDENILKEYGIENSADFVDTFYDIESYETTDSTGTIVKRDGLSSMKNLNWMRNILDRYIDYKGFSSMPDLPRPKQVDVKHYLKLSTAGEMVFKDIQYRIKKAMEDAKKVKTGQMSAKNVEIPLVAIGAGRSASIDLRLYDVGTKDKSSFSKESLRELIENDIQTTENNKILKTIELVTAQYKENPNSGQIIFLDRLIIKNGDGTVSSTHREIRDALLKTGLFSESEVVIVNGGEYTNPNTGKMLPAVRKTDAKGNVNGSSISADTLNNIMDLYNQGKIKVIIGNTSKLGVGVDLNRKTTDIYQLDIPFRPDEIEQRSNRGVRQGNENPEVRVHQFFQIGTFDKRSYDIVIAKRGFNDVYGFSDNNDVVIEHGTTKIDNGEAIDPYQAIIDLESDPFERERLRKQRTVDNAETDTISVKKVITKLESDIKTKNGIRKNYEEAIKGIDENLNPKNYPKYEAIKDEAEKQIKLDKHLQTLNERKAKYLTSIQENEDALAELNAKLQERKDQITKISADKKYITDEFTSDGTNVSIVKIKEVYTAEQILRSEGKSDAEIESYLRAPSKVSNMKAPSLKEGTKITPMKADKEDDIRDHYARAHGYDTPAINYVPPYSFTGLPSRTPDGFIMIGGDMVNLPGKEAPINADSLRVYVSDIIGNRLYNGRIKGHKSVGLYRHVDSSIRLKNYSDMEMLAHELAHYLDFFHNNPTRKATGSFFRKEILKNKDEVKSLSYTTNKNEVISEGFAEFVRLYLTNYNVVAQLAPNMLKDFEARLNDDPALKKKMVTLRNGMHQYYFQGATTRTNRGGELDATAKKIKRSQAEIGKEYRQKIIDRIHSIKRIEADIKGDNAHDAMNSPYKALQLVNGHSSIMYSAMNFGVPTVKANGDIGYIGKPLNAIFEPAAKHGEERIRLLEDYMVARRADELMKQGREKLISQEAIDNDLAYAQQYPEFETIFEEYQEFNRAMLDFYVGMNHITEAQRDTFLEFNQNYVPFNRIIDSVQNGKVVQMSHIGKRLTGGTHSLGNIMENIIDGLERNIKEAMVSRGKSMFYSMLEQSGMGGVYATRVPLESKLVKSDIFQQSHNVAEVMKQLGLSMTKDGFLYQGSIGNTPIDVEEIADVLANRPELMEFFTNGHPPVSGSESYIDSAIINGQRVYFETKDAGIMDAMTSFNGAHYNDAMYALMAVKNIMTWNITNNPLFYLTNAARDTVSASVLSKNGFIPIYSTMRGMYHYITQSKVYKDFMASGAGYGTIRTNTGGNIQAMRMLNVNRGFDLFNKFISAMAYGADMFEYGSRIGEFELAQKKGKSNWQAAFEGREINTDFAVHGSNDTITGLMATVPFMKAAINGLDKTARRIFSLNGEMKLSNAVKFRNALGEVQRHKIKIYAMGAIIAAATLALWASNRDDDRYKRLTRDQKLMYWHIFVGDIHFKIPRPYDIGFAFSALPEIIADGIYTKNGEDMADQFLFGMKMMFSVGDISGLFQPIADHLTNTNWMGSPIVPAQMQNLDDKSDQYTERTATMYKKIGKATGMSPVLMQHYVDGYLGLTAKMIEEATENILWDTKAWGDRPFAQNPLEFLTYRFTGKKEESRTYWSEKYYTLSQKAAGVKNSYEMKYKRANIDQGESFKAYASDKDKQLYFALDKAMGSLQGNFTDIRNGIEAITYDKGMSKAQKEEKINDLYKMKRELMEQAVKTIEEKIKDMEDNQ